MSAPGIKLPPAPGLGFTMNREGLRHDDLRPHVGKTGRIVGVLRDGQLVRVSFENALLRPLPLSFGEVVAAPADNAAALAEMASAPRIFVVELPLPYKEQARNFSGSWQDKAPAVADYRATAAEVYRTRICPRVCVQPLRTPIRIDLDFHFHKPENGIVKFAGRTYPWEMFSFPTDEDNARNSFKAGQDALQDAGIIKNDTAKYVTVGDTRLHHGDAAGGKTLLVATITEAGGAR